MVRPSGTEPIIRIYAESDSEKNLEILMKEYIEKIKSVLAIALKNHYDLFSSESNHIGVLLNA